jgi:beta-ketodecanoyl-[acyl-carrier-protein] synthase
MSVDVVISGAGLWKPPFRISNEELVASYNGWADRYNSEHRELITRGELEPKPLSSAEFIEKASGIRSRYAYEKEGILDITRMRPRIPHRAEDELSHQAEIALHSARQALAAAGRLNADGTAAGVDMVIVSCAYTERSYPAIAIEVQHALGIRGFGFDMLVACSAATFALQRAVDAILAESAAVVLVINPELTSPQVNYTDRDSHFIFGDVSTAMVLERAETARGAHRYQVLGRKAQTLYSNNIRSNFGYIAHAEDTDPFGPANLFHQNGRKVFKEVCPMAAEHL